MEQRRLGDALISALGIGAAQWSLGSVQNDEESEALLLRAVEAGVTYVDTAAAYTTASAASHNEKLISRVLKRFPGDVIVGTKGGHYRRGDTWPVDGTPAAIRAHCDTSLSALGVLALDLYYLHKPDPQVPFEDSVGTLEELRREGKVMRTGVSNVTADQFWAALRITPLSAVQNTFSPFDSPDLDLIEACQERSIAYFVFSPLGGSGQPQPLRDAMPRTNRTALRKGLSLESVVLSWELSLSPAIIPIIGVSRLATLEDSLAANTELFDYELRAAVASDLE